jgi:lipopolysaccharide export system protein LptA
VLRRPDGGTVRAHGIAVAVTLALAGSALGAEPPAAKDPSSRTDAAAAKGDTVAARAGADEPRSGAPASSGSSSTSTGFLADLPGASSDEPIVVHSKELEFDYQSNRVFYRGDVRATQGDIAIDCDELIVFFDRADDVRRAELRAVVATGNVVITQGERRATGGKAVFNQVDRQIALLENPVLRDGLNEVRGDRLTVYLDEGRSVMESGKKDRVSAVLYPGGADKSGGPAAKKGAEASAAQGTDKGNATAAEKNPLAKKQAKP